MKTKTAKSLLVDDETHATELLRTLIKENCSGIEIVGCANSGEEAFSKINLLRPEIVFMDIRLGDMMAFELLNKFENIFFQIVFTSAYDQYALEAFNYPTLHYLMKPIDVDQLKITVKRVEKSMLYSSYAEATEGYQPDDEQVVVDKLAFSTSNSTELINYQDIEYLTAEGSYTSFHLTDQTQRLSSKILGYYEKKLNSDKFCRTHRKYMVNLDHIVRFDKAKSLTLLLTSGSSIQVSQVYKERLLSKLQKRVTF